jgi:hypothetical protein
MNNLNQDSAKIPPARPEIIAEITAVDCLLADLFLKCQDNVREVDELAGVLDNHLGSCEEVRDTILDIRVENSDPGLTMIDLPMLQQRMIVSTGLFSRMLLEAIQVLTKSDAVALKEKLIEQVNFQVGEFSDTEVTKLLENYLKKHEELVNKHNTLASLTDNN